MVADEGRETGAKNSTQLGPPLRIVLCGTTHPGNIGAAARAMKTMGLDQLHLVDPKAGIFPSEEASARAVSATDVLDSAQVHETLLEAVRDCHLVVGTTARERHVGPPVLSPRAFCAQAQDLSGGGRVALVFGRERTGLTNEEVDLCQRLIRIPTHEAFASLNLAAAVQICCYEWMLPRASEPAPKETRYRPATAAEFDGFMNHLQSLVEQIDFFAEKNQPAVMRRVRQIFHRAAMDTNEINILRGLWGETQKALKRYNPE